MIVPIFENLLVAFLCVIDDIDVNHCSTATQEFILPADLTSSSIKFYDIQSGRIWSTCSVEMC